MDQTSIDTQPASAAATVRPEYRPTRLQGITDLTVVAPIKTGFVPGAFNSVTWAERLMRVLRTLNAVRQASRESALKPNPFADSIGRFRGIHFFRFAVVPASDASQQHRLLLNVTFDGGWEPYMRVIWGPLGTMLDLIFCHCEDYPMAFQCTFEDYTKWVRKHEVPSSFFYVDSAATVGDLQYLQQLERQIRNEGGRKFDDIEAAGLAMASQPSPTIPSDYAVSTSLRVLKAFEALRELFPTNQFDESGSALVQDGILLRFAQDLLRDLRVWIAQGLFDPGGTYDRISATFESERLWLLSPIPPPSDKKDRLVLDPHAVQGGIDESYPAEVRHGVLALLRIKRPERARQWLSTAPVTSAFDLARPADGIYRSLSLTFSGLQRLGIAHKTLLQSAPPEFIEGMESRAGLLGDVRGNHPDQWKRPRRNWNWDQHRNPSPPIELNTVHVVVQLRTALADGEAEPDGTSLLKRLEHEVSALEAEKTGLQVLFVQPMRLGHRPQGAVVGRDHFGYADGLSQPTFRAPAGPPSHWNDQVKTGDLFIGYSNSRGDRPQPNRPQDRLFDNGSFLIIRKLRQYPERFEKVVAAAAQRHQPGASKESQEILKEQIKAKLMGRQTDGTPLVKLRGPGNDFDFRSDAKGAQCPFQSHIRRANPRELLPLQPPPRIARRGMSYGPSTQDASNEPRGVMFMAYNANIAEQFEVIQRWLTGGNSSGLCSEQSDPFMGVPESGLRRTFRFVHEDQVVRVDLDDQPLVELEWGLYAFVPSIAALESIGSIVSATPATSPNRSEAPQAPSRRELWRLLLEDEKTRDLNWQSVRDRGGVLNAQGYGVLVGSSEKALEVLQDDGSNFSARGYGERMDRSIGLGFLGLDDVKPNDGHSEQSRDVNQAIEDSISEQQAFDAAGEHAQKYLERLLLGSFALTGNRLAPVHLVDLGRDVLAKLCTDWFGLPDEKLMFSGKRAEDRVEDKKARCPGHFLTVSKYVFSPHPTKAVSTPAQTQGKLLSEAVRQMLAEATLETLKPLVAKIVSTKAMKGNPKLQADTVAGVMLGFPPTVLANLVSVLIKWSESMQLWEFQQDLLELGEVDYSRIRQLLYEPFLLTMRQSPVPNVIWRTAVKDNPLGVDAKAGDPVIVGLGSAVAASGDSMLMFGGDRSGQTMPTTTHACPGVKMAMGVMLGITAALLSAGALRRTADPRVITLSAM